MAGHRNFSEMRKRMTPARRARNESAAQVELEYMLLSEMRRITGATQGEVAAYMGITQSALSRLESQGDMQVITLRRLVEALGGRLEMVATLPTNRVVVELVPQKS